MVAPEIFLLRKLDAFNAGDPIFRICSINWDLIKLYESSSQKLSVMILYFSHCILIVHPLPHGVPPTHCFPFSCISIFLNRISLFKCLYFVYCISVSLYLKFVYSPHGVPPTHCFPFLTAEKEGGKKILPPKEVGGKKT